jgi:hypothetical protein
MQPQLEIDWQWGDEELQVTVLGKFTAVAKRELQVTYAIDPEKRLIILHCQLRQSGRVYHHESALRGFCQIPLTALLGLDPGSCDWQIVLHND